MNRRSIIIGAALLALIVVAIVTRGFGLFGGDEDKQLTLYGNVDIREVDMAFRAAGRIDDIKVEEGQRVQSGELLASLDPRPVEDRVGEANAKLAEARADLSRLANGNRPQEIGQARARLASAEAQLANAQADFQRRQSLVGEGAISRDVWEQTVTALRQAEAQAQEARQALLTPAIGRAERRISTAARARVAAAQAARASSGDRSVRHPPHSQPRTARWSPARPSRAASSRPARPCSRSASTGRCACAPISPSPICRRISPGMKVLVGVDGAPRQYHGTIGYISPRAEFTPKSRRKTGRARDQAKSRSIG